MAVPSSRDWPRLLASAALLASVLLWAGAAEPARADANGGIAAAIGLTAADGSVRTQAGVRLSVSPAPGAPDRVLAIGTRVQARMPAVRECFSAAMARSPATQGHAEFEVEADGRGAKVKLKGDGTGDPILVACMKSSLAAAALSGVPRGSRALVRLDLNNPLAAMRKRLAEKPLAQDVRMLAGGRAESEGGAENVKFRVTGSAYAASTIAGVARDMSQRVAGLLDCRRKLFRRERESAGSITVDLSVRAGELARTVPRTALKPSASRCVSEWLTALDASALDDAELELAVSFAAPR